MAVIEKIRKRTGLLIITIAGAIALFLIQDALTNLSDVFGENPNDLGSIAGENITREEFTQEFNRIKAQTLLNQQQGPVSDDQIRNQVWSEFISKYALGREFDALGLNVTTGVDGESTDMIYGLTIHEYMTTAEIFLNDKKEFDPIKVNEFLDGTEAQEDGPEKEQQKARWDAFKDGMIKDRQMSKYENLLSKTNYVTTAEAKHQHMVQNSTVDFDYIWIPFSKVEQDSIEINDAMLEDYLVNNKNKYSVKEDSRQIKYVSFEVKPSGQDSIDIKASIDALVKPFGTTSDAESFVFDNSDGVNGIQDYKAAEIPFELKRDTSTDLSVGSVIGPVISYPGYKLFKVLSKRADTVNRARASHILFKTDELTNPLEIAQKRGQAQAILAQALAGRDFASLARDNSEGPSAPRGGDLGDIRPGQMVPTFDSAVFAATSAGVVPELIETQFGFHIINITQPPVKDSLVTIATVEKSIIASQVTTDKAFVSAQNLWSNAGDLEGLEKAIEADSSLVLGEAKNLKVTSKYIAGLGESPLIVNWAFRTQEVGELMEETPQVNGKFVVVGLSHISEKGNVQLADVKDEVTRDFRNQEISVKLMSILNEFEEDLNIRAEKINDKYGHNYAIKETAANVKLSDMTIPHANREPIIIGTAFGLEEGKWSKSLVADNGVFIVVLKKKNTPEVKDEEIDIDALKESIAQPYSGQDRNKISIAVTENADIEDKRYKL